MASSTLLIKKIFFISVILLPVVTTAQNLLKNTTYQAGLSTYFTTGNELPFWLHSNQYGEVPFVGNVLQLMASVNHEYDSTYSKQKKLNKIAFGYGLRAIGNVGRVNQIRLTEAYIKGRHGPFELYAGRRREIIGLVDSTLSSGSYIWSGNSLPIPKVQLSFPNYTPITKEGLISIKGSFNHGWFGSSDSVRNYYLHQKTFYVRWGKHNWHIKFYTGFNHQVQWGGRPATAFYDSKTQQTITKFPSGFSTYFKVVSGLSLNRNLNAGTTKDGVPYNEAFNRAGNHLGTIDIAMEYKSSIGTFLLYRQNIYEDGSLYYLNNITDGLQGISLRIHGLKGEKFLELKRINLEYLNTSNQGGFIGSGGSTGNINQLRGQDNYFNNSLYKDGYTYKGYTIGSPFIMPFIYYQNSFSKEIGKTNPNYLLNNRIKSFNVASTINIKQNLDLLLRYTTTNNLGNYSAPVSFTQNSVFLQASLFRKNWITNLVFSFDQGGLLPMNYGTMISFQKGLF